MSSTSKRNLIRYIESELKLGTNHFRGDNRRLLISVDEIFECLYKPGVVIVPAEERKHVYISYNGYL